MGRGYCNTRRSRGFHFADVRTHHRNITSTSLTSTYPLPLQQEGIQLRHSMVDTPGTSAKSVVTPPDLVTMDPEDIVGQAPAAKMTKACSEHAQFQSNKLLPRLACYIVPLLILRLVKCRELKVIKLLCTANLTCVMSGLLNNYLLFTAQMQS